MAFLGDFGKIFLGGANTGTVIGGLTGSPSIGLAAQRGADFVSKVNASQRQNVIGGQTAVSQAPQTMPQESASSGTGREFLGFSDEMGGGFEPVFTAPQASFGGMQAQQVAAPAIIGGGLAIGRGLGGLLFGGLFVFLVGGWVGGCLLFVVWWVVVCCLLSSSRCACGEHAA